jgi:hypothetical protein
MTNILLLRRIQTDQEWEADCKNIAQMVFNSYNLNIPHIGYKNIFIEFLQYRLEHFEYDLELEGFLSDVQSYGSDEVYSITLNMDIPYLDISNFSTSVLQKLIIEKVDEYYSFNKKDLIKKLEDLLLKQECVIIYPNKFYFGILKRFFNSSSYKTYHSSYNNDNQCIKEFTDKYKISPFGYNIININ